MNALLYQENPFARFWFVRASCAEGLFLFGVHGHGTEFLKSTETNYSKAKNGSRTFNFLIEVFAFCFVFKFFQFKVKKTVLK